jgi:N-carbamoylputrescine amidase
MNGIIRIALIQLAWSGDVETMKTQYRELIREAAARGARLVCLPELSLTPYFPGTRAQTGFDWAENLVSGGSARFFSEMAREHGLALIGSIYEDAGEQGLFDTVSIHAPGGALVGATRKVHIPSGPAYYETDFFAGSDSYPTFDLSLPAAHPATLRVATPTCYDQWFPELARIYALNGAELIIYPTAIGDDVTDREIDYRDAWQTVMRGHAIANGVFVVAINRVGVENGVTFFGSSFVCDPMGTILAQAGQTSTEVLLADLDPRALARWRGLFPLLHQRRPETYQGILGKWAGEPPPAWMEETPSRRMKPGH